MTVYSDSPDTLLVTLIRYDGYFYGGLPVTTTPLALNDKSLLVAASSKIVAKYKDVSTGVAKSDSAKMNLPDSLVSSSKISISFGKSTYYDTTDKAVILLKDYRLSDGFPVTVHVGSPVDEGRDILLYPVNDGDGTERIGFVGFSVDEPGELAVKVEDGKDFTVSYGGKSATATWVMTEFFGLDCTEDGGIVNGVKYSDRQYVCDKSVFRKANLQETSIGKGCTNYNLNEKFGDYTCLSEAWVFDPARVQKDTLVDSRDNQIYKTVKIGTQTWMAENLNFRTTNSKCYGDSASNCTKYGCLYTWTEAKTACPSSWHLPREEEFRTLFATVGGSEIAGSVLKSASGWEDYEETSGNGDDSYSFAALPAGRSDRKYDYFTSSYVLAYYDKGTQAFFWSSQKGDKAYYVNLNHNSGSANLNDREQESRLSVRCIKD